MKDWTERAAKIGATTVRIFAGSLEKGDTLADAQKRVVAAHERVLRGGREARRPARAGKPRRHHRHARAPARTRQAGEEPGAGREHRHRQLPHRRTPTPTSPRSRPYGVVSQVKTEVSPGGKKQEADLGRVVKILKDANFHGYVALEYEAKEDPKVAVPKYVKELRKLIG